MFDPMSPEDLARVATLEAEFTRIGEERMKDIGLYNPVLKVESVGFRRWENWLAGILVTPWFMNFIMLPTSDDQITAETMPLGTAVAAFLVSSDVWAEAS